MSKYTILNLGPTNWERLDIETSPGLTLSKSRIEDFIQELQTEGVLTASVEIHVTENPTTEIYP